MSPLTVLFQLFIVYNSEDPEGLSQLLQKSKGQRGFGLKMCGLRTNEIIKSFKKTRSTDLQGQLAPALRSLTRISKRCCVEKCPMHFHPGLEVLQQETRYDTLTSIHAQ